MTSPAHGFDVLIFIGISLEFKQVLWWVFKIEPWSLRCNIPSTVRVTSPAILHSVKVIIWVGICVGLISIQALIVSIQPILWLQYLWIWSSNLGSIPGVGSEEWYSEEEEVGHWEVDVVVLEQSSHEWSFEWLQKCLGGHWLGLWG